MDGQIQVVKESGTKEKVYDRRCWAYKELEAARKFFNKQVKYKTNPNRKSPRKYRLLDC
jgi:hypothetical protein